METTRQEICFSDNIEWWVDVLSFEETLERDATMLTDRLET
jgi:hypothetical protein